MLENLWKIIIAPQVIKKIDYYTKKSENNSVPHIN